MSIFGALATAVSGLTAQSSAFVNISNNVANSQTTGFKQTNTVFSDLVTSGNQDTIQPGTVQALAQATNNVQGSITASSDPTAMAISGNGFFSVQEASSVGPDTTSFSPIQYYTRQGDFALNSQGYLENSAGEYLQAWPVDPTTGAVNQAQLQTVQIPEGQFDPIATTSASLSANLPATPAAGASTSSQIQVYDSLGNPQTLTVNWAQNSDGNWTATVESPNNVGGATIGTAQVLFGSASGNPVAQGTVGAVTGATGSVTGSTYGAGGEATLTAVANFGQGNQTITIDLGPFGGTSGVTQFAGTAYQLNNVSQNGVGPGSFSGVSLNQDGSVVVNYTNGQSQTLAQVPLTVFADPNGLGNTSGQAFTATRQSGLGAAQAANTGAAGSLAVGSVEQSNVDIANQFSQLIVAQQAYGASAKVVTTADQMLVSALDMKQ
jgi:flagellar hook protein FlgE